MVRKESHRECVYTNPVLVAIYAHGCAPKSAPSIPTFWMRPGQPDKNVDPRVTTNVTTFLKRVVVCPGGAIKEPGGEHPPGDRLIPVELPRDGRTLVGGSYILARRAVTVTGPLGHWTGSPDRLHRLSQPGSYVFGSQEYAKEELRAERRAACVVLAVLDSRPKERQERNLPRGERRASGG